MFHSALAKLVLNSFIFQSDSLCVLAVEKDKQKLLSNLNANLAKLCGEMPHLFERLRGEYPTSEEALRRAEKISDEVFSELADKEIGRVRRALAYHLDRLN